MSITSPSDKLSAATKRTRLAHAKDGVCLMLSSHAYLADFYHLDTILTETSHLVRCLKGGSTAVENTQNDVV